MLILEAVNLKKYYGDRLIISVNDFKIQTGDKVGVIGDNGAGKTTFLNILSGDIDIDMGIVKRYSSIAYIKQFLDKNINGSGKLFKEFEVHNKSNSQNISGGECAKLNIADELSKDSELLLADEPTSNLDYKSICILKEKFMKIGTLVLISHDRDFMDSICNKIVEINNGKLFLYYGNYSSYKKQKVLELKKQREEYEKYIEEKTRLHKAMMGVHSKSKSIKKAPNRMGNSEARLHKGKVSEKKKKVDSSLKRIKSRIKKLEIKERPDRIFNIGIDFSLTNPPENKIIMSGSDLSFEYGNKQIFCNAKFKICNGLKTAIVGCNGSGKTTLLNLIDKKDKHIHIVPKATIGYFHQDLSILNFDKTVFQNVMKNSVQDESEVRRTLAKLLICGDKIYNKVSTLSGGERVRVSFARLFVSDANVLLFDEPTNYLDVKSIGVFENFLKDYKGTVIYVSHDKAFINATADRLLIIQNKKITEFEGNLKEFEEIKKVPQKQKDTGIEKSILQMKLTYIVTQMSLKNCNKDELEKEYEDIVRRLRKL